MSRRVTTWSRLEPRPRNDEMLEGLRGTLRDPLWLLSRQWQLKEFQGEDAGSPVEVDVTVEHDELTKVQLRGADDPVTVNYEDAPLEALVERERIMTDGLEEATASSIADRDATDPPNREVAAEAGMQFLRLLDEQEFPDGGSAYGAADFPDHLRLSEPDDPVMAEDRRYLRVMAGRTLDGAAVYLAIDEAGYDGTAANPWSDVTNENDLPAPIGVDSSDGDFDLFKDAIEAYEAWYRSLYEEPPTDGSAWDPTRMEYDFAVATGAADTPERRRSINGAVMDGGYEAEKASAERTSRAVRDLEDHPEPVETVLAATEYDGGSLDWYSFAPAAGDVSLGATAFATTETSKTLLPRHVSFPGMPAPRWWEFEDAAVSLDDIAADGVATPRLLLLEFATQFGNDWFQFPVETPVGSLSRITNLTVTDSFGITTDDADAAATGSEPPWRLFSYDLPGRESPGLFLPPTLPDASVHESDPIERVLLTRDEMANLVFGIEQLVEGATGQAIDRSEFRRPQLAITNVEKADSDDIVDDEFIEFFNPGDDEFDVTGYAVRREDGTELIADLGTVVQDGTIQAESSISLYTGTNGSNPSLGRNSSFWRGADAAVVVDGDDVIAKYLMHRPSDALADYRLSTDVADHWFPFTMEVDKDNQAYRLVRSLLLDADTLGVDIARIPRPDGEILGPADEELPAGEDNLKIYEEEVTKSGLEVTRRYRLASWTDGAHYLWSGRNATIGRGESSSGLLFDILEERDGNE